MLCLSRIHHLCVCCAGTGWLGRAALLQRRRVPLSYFVAHHQPWLLSVSRWRCFAVWRRSCFARAQRCRFQVLRAVLALFLAQSMQMYDQTLLAESTAALITAALGCLPSGVHYGALLCGFLSRLAGFVFLSAVCVFVLLFCCVSEYGCVSGTMSCPLERAPNRRPALSSRAAARLRNHALSAFGLSLRLYFTMFANEFLEKRIFLHFVFENIKISRCRCVPLFRSALSKLAVLEAKTVASDGRKDFNAHTASKSLIQRLDAENLQSEV